MKQKLEKFGDLDRNQVIQEIQERCDVKLKKVGRRSKWLRDASGKSWWVLGGIGTWHGIPEEMMEDERRAQVEGVLVIAVKKSTGIDVFNGPLGPLVNASNELSRGTQPAGDYYFNVEVRGTHMRCIEVPNLVLARFATIPYSAEDRERDRKLNEFQKSVSAMSLEDLTALRDELNRIAGACTARPLKQDPSPVMKTVTGWMDRALDRLIMVLREAWYLALIIGAIVAVIGLVLEFTQLAMVVL